MCKSDQLVCLFFFFVIYHWGLRNSLLLFPMLQMFVIEKKNADMTVLMWRPCLINVNVWSRNLNSERSAELLPVDPARCCQLFKGEDCACKKQTNRADLREFGGLPSPESGVMPDSTFSHYFTFTTAIMFFSVMWIYRFFFSFFLCFLLCLTVSL